MNIYTTINAPSSSNLVLKSANTEFDIIEGGLESTTSTNYYAENNTVLEGNNFRHTDYSISIYANTIQPVHALHSNNMLTPVTPRTAMKPAVLASVIDYGSLGGMVDGVYIVERYDITRLHKQAAVDLLEYYRSATDISYDDNVVDLIKDEMTKATTVRGMHSVSLRIITFVPYNSVLEEHMVYVRGPNLLLIAGDVPVDVVHPYSHNNLENSLNNIIDTPGSVDISISIVDLDDVPQYIKVGTSSIKVPPIKTPEVTKVLPEGCSIKVKRGGTTVKDVFIEKEDFKTHGLYRSKGLCLSDGDRLGVLEEKKYETEISKYATDLEKAKLELAKIKEANAKLIAEKRHREMLHKQELEHKTFSNTMDINKKLFDLEVTRSSKLIDIHASSIKAGFERNIKIMDYDLNAKYKQLEYRRSTMFKATDFLLKVFTRGV